MKAKPAIFGSLLAVGTFDSSVLIVALLLVLWAGWESSKELPPVPGVLLAGAIAATAPLAVVPWHPLVISIVVLSIAILGRSIRRKWHSRSFFLGLFAGVAPQLLAAVATWGDHRPELLSLNASQVAQTGLMFWLILPTLNFKLQQIGWLAAAIQMSVAVSRAPMIVAFVYVLQKPDRRRLIMFAGITLVFAVAMYSQGLGARLTPWSLSSSAGIRYDLLNPDDSAMIVVENSDGFTGVEITTDQSKFTAPSFSLTGYGNGNYIAATGIVRPHNVPVLIAYEMGLLAMIPFAVFGWAVITRRIPWDAALSLLLLWQVVEEPAGRFEGMFTTAAVLIALWRRPLPLSDLARYARGRLRIPA